MRTILLGLAVPFLLLQVGLAVGGLVRGECSNVSTWECASRAVQASGIGFTSP